jgi:hypothetical protein
VSLDDAAGGGGRFVRPEEIDQAVHRDQAIGLQGQHSQHGTLLTGTDVHGGAAADQAYRSQQLELHVLPLKNAIFPVTCIRADASRRS